jgi:hypothetical protein
MAARKTQERIPPKELREYLKLPVDEELSEGPGEEVRILPDGRVLWKLVGLRATATWPSREAFTEHRRRNDEEAAKQVAAGNPSQILTLLPPIDDFLRDVEAYAKNVGPRLRIPDEVLDGTVASLGTVDKALKRIPLAERPVPDLVTPLVAYVGEVLRRASGGRWFKHSLKKQVPVCDPDEFRAHLAIQRKVQRRAVIAADKAKAEAKARGASAEEVEAAYLSTLQAIQQQVPGLKSYRLEDREDQKPLVTASNGRSFDPFADVFIPMVEPSKRNPLRPTVEARLHGAGYPQAPKPAQ